MSELPGKYDVSVAITAAEIEAARIEREHAQTQAICGCAVCVDQRYQRTAKREERLRAIEAAARAVVKQFDDWSLHPPERDALDVLESALGNP